MMRLSPLFLRDGRGQNAAAHLYDQDGQVVGLLFAGGKEPAQERGKALVARSNWMGAYGPRLAIWLQVLLEDAYPSPEHAAELRQMLSDLEKVP